jgi:flagellar protein FlaG
MNVKPVSTPGPVATGQAVQGEAFRASTGSSSSNRGETLRRSAQAVAESPANNASAPVDQNTQVSSEDRQTADQLRSYIKNDDVQVSTRHDDASGRSVVEVRDKASGEVVTQYPAEELIRLYAALRESLVDESA